MKVVEPSRRNGFWILLRRVPKRYAGFDARKLVRISTHIRIVDDPNAIRAAPIVNHRVVDDGVQIRTANKSIGTVSRMLRRVSDAKELSVPAILSGLRIEGGIARQRPPFEISFIKSRILSPGVFDELNEEARRVIYVMV